jgi:serine/threonine protein kinase/tetratricopeptide (TPR) repeat protein
MLRIDAEVARMASAWSRGEQTTAAEILAQNPDLDDEAAVRLIYEEFCLRKESGQDVATSEVIRRYARWRADLEPLLGFDRLIRLPGADDSPAVFPQAGDQLGDFRLLAEMGRGAAGRTYLAAQPSLADRPVVLKVTARNHNEHLSLARLQHTHIVPLYSEQVFPDHALRGLCMPFLGGSTLARLLDDLSALAPERRRGRDLLEALDRHPLPAGALIATHTAGPYRQFFAKASYDQAICCIGACLADALQYAHDHGLVHMDVKPSNVLIAGDGQPMLLDFHLAESPLWPGNEPPVRLGGTRGWISPEQDAAMRALAEERPVTQAVDRRSDIYSLGLLLYASLGGPCPQAGTRETDRPRLDRCNPKLSIGLADIVHKCLEVDPRQRYPDAATLADDLRRHINDLPLRGVKNRSQSEIWAKWRRRRPDALERGSATVVALVAAAIVTALVWGSYDQRKSAIQSDLADARRLQSAHRFEEAVKAAERGRALAARTYFVSSLASALDRQLNAAELGRKADAVHALADQIRFRYGAEGSVTGELRSRAPAIQKAWNELYALLPNAREALDRATQERLETDLLELATIWAHVRVQLAGAGPADPVARREALDVLEAAEAAFGARPALSRERAALADTLGHTLRDRAPPPAPRSARDHDDLGRSFLRSGNLLAAAQQFRRALDLEPQDFWANFDQGLCAYRLGQYDEAIAAFRACVTLAPRSAECRFNRALAYERTGRADLAFHDYTQATELDPKLGEAFLNRGLLSYRAGRHEQAIADLRRALGCPADRETEARIRYNLALALRAAGDGPLSASEARRAVDLGFTDARALLSPVAAPGRPGR